MQESKETGPHITTREELDALYKDIKAKAVNNEETSVLPENQDE